MTAVQQARAAGFQALAAQRGVCLTLLPEGVSFLGLVEQYQSPLPGSPADSGPRLVDEDKRTAVRLAILRSALAGKKVEIGSVFRDDTMGGFYRVVRIERGGVDILDRFTCEREGS
ncbi:MAG: hypothetical protein M5U12_30610 [Verrucomicrobia bacterium]|nr:hypothetical protein [Verrucomicrobiota bacterium]